MAYGNSCPMDIRNPYLRGNLLVVNKNYKYVTCVYQRG